MHHVTEVRKRSSTCPDSDTTTTNPWYASFYYDCRDLVRMAQNKILREINEEQWLKKFPLEASAAILDCRVMLPYTCYHEARVCQATLISNHMRIVYSTTCYPQEMLSGYPPEPILAEAAARQLHVWRRSDRSESYPSRPSEITLLSLAFQPAVTAPGREATYTVGRLLLTMAHDDTSVAEHARRPKRTDTHEQQVHFSEPVSLVGFLEQLLSQEVAEEFLNSRPNNLPEEQSVTLREAFSGALVNFTHFVECDTSMERGSNAARAAFIRNMAYKFLSSEIQDEVEVLIPVYFPPRDRSQAGIPLANLSGILVQFRPWCSCDATWAGYNLSYKNVGLFAKVECDRMLPYITLTMLLDLKKAPPPPDFAKFPAVPEVSAKDKSSSEDSSSAREENVNSEPQDIAQSDPHDPPHHPRYSIALYGCSPALYRGVTANAVDIWQSCISWDPEDKLVPGQRWQVRPLDAFKEESNSGSSDEDIAKFPYYVIPKYDPDLSDYDSETE